MRRTDIGIATESSNHQTVPTLRFHGDKMLIVNDMSSMNSGCLVKGIGPRFSVVMYMHGMERMKGKREDATHLLSHVH